MVILDPKVLAQQMLLKEEVASLKEAMIDLEKQMCRREMNLSRQSLTPAQRQEHIRSQTEDQADLVKHKRRLEAFQYELDELVLRAASSSQLGGADVEVAAGAARAAPAHIGGTPTPYARAKKQTAGKTVGPGEQLVTRMRDYLNVSSPRPNLPPLALYFCLR